ncbi:MAG: DUF86 domain-containing protein [Deltaproteobacteria bacterium]|nr:DUF86 domain-containing protein [Deltaproteobacteria bacterium]
MVDEDVLSRKISHLKGYLDELRRAEDITWDKYRSDVRSRAFVERYVHLAIEAVIDVANHLVSFEGWREPQGYRDLFLVLSENGVIPQQDLASFQDMASFRNLLVHRYDRVDDEIVFGVFRRRLTDFDRFVDLVAQWASRPSDP